jgi:hypothetical protein
MENGNSSLTRKETQFMISNISVKKSFSQGNFTGKFY